MKLLYPPALFFLISIPIIIAMYILKQKFEEKKVSSLYLWEQVLKDIDVNTPWQRLKSSLPLILQLLLALLLTFALTDPFLLVKGKGEQKVIVVLDTTGSMNAIFKDSTTKFEEGVKRAEKLINSLSSGSKVTIISSGKSPKIEISDSNSREDVLNKLKSLRASNSYGNIEDSLSLVKSISKQQNDYKAVFFTDKNVDIKDINGEVQPLNSYSENVSLDYISHSIEKNGISALVRINNRSDNSQKREIGIYGDEKLISLKDVELKPKEVKTLYFNDIPANAKYIHGEISEKDTLLQDNTIYEVIKNTKSQKVLLVSKKNIFIEKSISSLNNIELYKTDSIENIIDSYDLYIFDGLSPKELPKEGAVLLINPSDSMEEFKVKGESKGGEGEIAVSPVTKYMENAHFTAASFKNIEIPYWGSEFFKINNKPAGFIGELKGRRIGVLGFDLHNSDFTLTPEFPIFMNNIVSYLTNADFQEKSSYYCGDGIGISNLTDADKLYMKSPLGKDENIEVKYPIEPFENTNDTGIYTLKQINEKGEKDTLFAVNFPSDKESSVEEDIKPVNNVKEESLLSSLGVNLKSFLIAAVLILLAAEWMVYVYGY